MPFQPYPLAFAPGVQRDGTELDSVAFTAAQWCRFQRGRPRKMGGYKMVSQNMTAISRALHMQTQSGFSYVHSGYAAGIELVTVDANGDASIPANRTPGGFTVNANNVWQMDSYFDINSGLQQLLAFQVPGLMDVAYGASTGNLYAGNIYNTTALTAVSGLAGDATGGIVMLPPYLGIYGSNGLFQWSAPAAPLDLFGLGSGAARVTDQKVVKGLPLSAQAGFSPSAILWSINGVIKLYFVGGAPVFDFDPLTTQSSILSHMGVVEGANRIYYWAAQDRFMSTDGQSVQDVPNNFNVNFFFDNLNRTYSQKVFAVYNARWNEIWWCAPLFGATEPNWAIIYNDREKIWYDTPLPNAGRSAGVENDVNIGAIMAGIQASGSTYRLWQHERGTDEVDGSNTSAVLSSYTTPIITAANFQQPLDKAIHIDAIEMDLVQSGDMTVTPLLRGNARSAFIVSDTVPFGDSPPADPIDQLVNLKTTAKQTKLRFTSNVAGGDFQGGKDIAYIEVDQARRTQ